MNPNITALFMLPVEMLVTILRFLDGKSLLNVALADNYFTKVCEGDTVLRNKIGTHIQEEKERNQETAFFSKQYFGLFPGKASNVPESSGVRMVMENNAGSAEGIHNALPGNNRKAGGRSLSRARAEPYKNFRC